VLHFTLLKIPQARNLLTVIVNICRRNSADIRFLRISSPVAYRPIGSELEGQTRQSTLIIEKTYHKAVNRTCDSQITVK